MIVSVGIDLIEVARVRRTIERTPRFLARVFTENERAYCDARGTLGVAAKHYAVRFAAKEAAMKALGTGWSQGVAWHDVEVVALSNGAPRLVLRNRALELFDSLGAIHTHLSLSHTNEHAIAQVLFES